MLSGGIDTPHPDIELGATRSRLGYIAAAPDAGITRDTGLLLFIAGYGMAPSGGYAQSLISHLANRYDCLAASVSYFGADFQLKGRRAPLPDFFLKLEQHYGLSIAAPPGIDMDRLVIELAKLLGSNGMSELHSDCRIGILAEEYNSMGFLPALDCLQVAHRLIGEHALNRRRVFLLGTSYGGYIASLMAKLAPETFRLVVDNSGFSSAEDDLRAVMGRQSCRIEGVAIQLQSLRSWSPDPAAPNYFSAPRRQIRSLFEPGHLFPNTARIYAYHAEHDRIAPTERKLRLREAYAGKAAYDLRIIGEADLDGSLFKTPAHGMSASLRGLFALSYERYLADGGARADHTDFDLEAERRFACSGEDYVLRFSSDAGVQATLSPHR